MRMMNVSKNATVTDDTNGSNRTKFCWCHFVLLTLAVSVITASLIGLLFWKARHDVLSECYGLSEGNAVTAKFGRVWLSPNHGIIIGYDIEGVPELNYAYWYFIPREPKSKVVF